MSSSTKSALLSAVVLLASALSSEAAKISFHRTSLPHNARQLLARGTHVSRMGPSRIARDQRVRLEARQDPTDEVSSYSWTKDLYTAPITVGDKEYTVVLDMSYADIWLDSAPSEGYEETDVEVKMEHTFTAGTLELEGTVGTAPLTFGTYEVEDQAFLNIHDDQGELHSTFGFNGFFGLGVSHFNPSPVNDAIWASEGADSTTGRPVLENIFASNSSMGRFIAIDLGRKEDTRDIEGINLSIGEYPEEWSEIQETPSIDLYGAESSGKWTALVDSMSIGEVHYPGKRLTLTSKVSGVPKGSAVAHFSITEPDTYLPLDLFEEIYKSIEDSAGFTTENGEKRYLVPCLQINVLRLTIDERSFPVHPLDLSEIWDDSEKPEALKEHTVCVSSFRAITNTSETYDMTLGSTFMRNVEAVFGYPTFDDKGETVEEAYLLLQADTEEDKAWTQVASIRQPQLKDLPEELEPSDAVELLKDSSTSKSSDSKSKSNNDKHGSPTHASNSDSSPDAKVLKAQGGAESASSGLSQYMPAVLGLLAANLLVALVLVAFAVLNYVKKGANGKRTGPHIYVPVKSGEQH